MTKYVNIDNLNFRSGPGKEYSIIGILNKNQVVEVIQTGEWTKISCLGKVGYVYSIYLSDAITKYVGVDSLNLRSGPGITYPVIAVLNKNQAVEVIKDGAWANVKVQDKIGYVNSTYISTKPILESTEKENSIVTTAKAKLGTPYVWGANGPSSFDCSGFTKYVYYTALGVSLPRVSVDQSKYGEYVSIENLRVADLIFFDTDLDGVVNHVGIYLGSNTFIHAATGNDMKVVMSTMSDYYKTRFINGRRIINKV